MTRNRKLIVDELLTKPSGVSPMLFVGLGGAGCKMAERIARHLNKRPDFKERYRDLVKFAMVDTNVNDLESYREVADATFLISDFEKEEYANLASGKRFLEADEYFTQWVPSNYRFRSGDTSGAGQIRIESRLGVYYQMKHRDFVPRFRRLLEDLKSHEHGHRKLDSNEIRIVVCYSIAGGTGSGCHLPVAYMLRDEASDLGRPSMIGVAVMPAVFEDKVGVNKDGTYANGYAALKETEHLMKLGSPDSQFFPAEGLTFHYNPADTSKREVRERPFDFVYLVDKPESFSVRDPLAAAADGLYLQFFSPLFGAQLSDYDNYTQYQRFLVPEDFEERGIPGFSTFYGSFGCAVLLVPVDGLVDYCSQAAALALLRASFLGEIPSDPMYSSLRVDSAPFYEVKERDDDDAQVYTEAEIREQGQEHRRQRLQDRLFMKRVRLLAFCEQQAEKEGRFRGIFRHGHYFGTLPLRNGDFVFDPEHDAEEMKAERSSAGGKLENCIGGVVLLALVGLPGKDPGLLARARHAIQEKSFKIGRPMTVRQLIGRAVVWQDDLKREGLRRLRDGYTEGALSYPGMDDLVSLDFIRKEAGGVELTAKRYAVLSILELASWDQPGEDEPDSGFDVQGKKSNAKIKPDDELVDHLLSQARDKALRDVRREFLKQLGALKKALDDYADKMRDLEQGSTHLVQEYGRRLERLQTQGDDSANQYILDAEALQGEDNRRFWDFFFEDQISTHSDLTLSSPRVRQILSDTVVDLAQQSSSLGGATQLEKLFTELRKYARGILIKRIGGDPHSPDPELREGVTLSDALELEIIYRALYRNHYEQIRGDGGKVIRRILAEYRSQPKEEQIDFSKPVHREYLQDKIRRVVTEKASLLCVYKNARDQHGGVRPNHVFLAAIDANFKNSNIEEALRKADIPDLTWVSSDWHNEKEVIFYRAVLNVPLYTFGRLEAMKHHYEKFRERRRRSKTLHIDGTWEADGALHDLDPETIKEQHRKTLVRNEIINFTALLKSAHPRIASDEETTCIIRRGGRYLLLPPSLSRAPEDHEESLYSHLGNDLASSIHRLPAVLDAERVSFGDYRESLRGVRKGLAPRLLLKIISLPFEWRRQYEDLVNHYAQQRTPKQQELLKDLKSSYWLLSQALIGFLDDLRNRQLESRTQKEDFTMYARTMSKAEAQRALNESIQVLSTFQDRWSALEGESKLPQQPRTFKSLLEPVGAERLDQMLRAFRDNLSSAPIGEAIEESPTDNEPPADDSEVEKEPDSTEDSDLDLKDDA